MNKTTTAMCGVFCLLALPVPAMGQVPHVISFSGHLADEGVPVTGTHDLSFALFDDGGTATCGSWSEDHTGVSVDNGVVFLRLGEITALPTSCFDGGELFLEVTVDGTVLSPRVSLGTTGYAIRAEIASLAEDAATVGGLAPDSLLPKGSALACTGTDKVVGIEATSGNLVCAADETIADTNASTICSSGEYLSGSGTCDVLSFTDTNASTLCSAGEYLSGSGTCDTLSFVDTNASTICSAGQVLNGDGSCDAVDGTGLCATGSVCAGGHDHTALDIVSGTLSTSHFDAYNDLFVSGRLDNNSPSDLLTRSQADGRYLRTDLTRVGYSMVDASTMSSYNSSNEYGAFYGGVYTTGTDTAWQGSAKLDVPNGATITHLYVYAYDNNSTDDANFSCTLYRRAHASPTGQVVMTATRSTTGASTTVGYDFSASVVTFGSDVISTSSYTYYLFAYTSSHEASTNLRHHGCRVRFTYDEVLP